MWHSSLFTLLDSAVPKEVVDAAQNLANTTVEAMPSTNEIQEVADAFTSLIPPIISNNYSLVLGALFIYVALHILKSGLKLALCIAIFAVVTTVLTNMGIMPDLNSIYASFMEFLDTMRQTPLPGV